MSDEVSARLGIDSAKWAEGLSQAQRHTVAFMGFMENMNAVLLKLAGGSMEAGAGIAAIGGVSAETQATLSNLLASGAEAGKIMAAMGSTSEAVNAQVMKLIVGNSNVEQSLAKLGLAFKKQAIDEGLFVEARRKVLSMAETLKDKLGPGQMRDAVDPTTGKKKRGMSPDILLTKDIDFLAEQGLLQQAKRYRKLVQMADVAGVKIPKFSLGFGEDDAAKNLSKIGAAIDIVKDKIAKLKRIKDQHQAEDDARLKRNIQLMEETEAYRLKLLKDIRKEKKKIQDQEDAELKRTQARMKEVEDYRLTLLGMIEKEKAEIQAKDDARLKRTLAGIEMEQTYRMKLLKMIEKEKAEKLQVRRVDANREMNQMFVHMEAATARKYITKPDTSGLFGSLFGVGGKLESKMVAGTFSAIERGSQTAAKGVMSLVRSLSSAGSSMAFMTASISGLFALVTGATLGATFKMASDFEHAMQKIMILVKKGESDLPRLTSQVKEFSKAFGMSPMASAEGFRIAISSDVPPGEIRKFMDEAGKLAVTHSTSIEKTADMMSMMRNAFKLTTEDMSRLRDMIFVMTDRGRVEVDQFAGEIGKISSVAALAGVNMQEMLAGFAALSRTKGPEQAGTMLINLFKLITKQGPEAKKILRDLGITLSPEQTKAEGFIKQIEKIREALAKNPALIEQMTEDFRELRAWGEITGSQFEALKSIFEDMFASVGEGDIHLGEMMNTTEVRWNRLMAQMRISAMEMGSGLMEGFREWIDKSGGVEAAMLGIQQKFKTLELASRYFLGTIQFVATGVAALMGIVAAAVYSVWKGMQGLATATSTAFNMTAAKIWLAELRGIDETIKSMKNRGASDDAPKIQELTAKRNELQAKITEANDKIRENDKKVEQTFQEWGKGIGMIFEPAKASAKALGDNADKIHELQQEIRDLDTIIENSKADHEALLKFQESLKIKTSTATEAIRDQAAAVKELVINKLKEQVKDGEVLLKQWVHDNSDSIKNIISGYRKMATEQEQLTKNLQRQLKDLTKDRERYDDAVQQSIDRIEEQDKTPGEIMKSRIERGELLEKRANIAAGLGDRDEVQRLIGEASSIYESILGIDTLNTKKNRETVVDALERLRTEMDKVYQAEQTAIEDKMALSEQATAAFLNNANVIETRFKAFSQSIIDLTRDMQKLGQAPDQQALEGFKTRIMELMEESQFFLDIQEDPAIEALDRTIEKIKAVKMELSTVPDFLLKALANDEATKNMLLQGTGATVAPVGTSSTSNNTTNTTNVDMRGTTINAGSEGGGPKKADARKLARVLKRHIERGEAPALTRRK